MIYTDGDSVFKEENEILGGMRFSTETIQYNQASPDVWSNFYDKLNETYVR